MSKSIEAMWKQGFVSEGELSAPKVNDLYNRKSQNIVDKLQNMFAVNIKAIVIGALIMLVVMSLIGAPWLKNSIGTYSKYIRFFYPLFYIGMVTQGLVSDAGTKVMVVLLKYYPTENVFLAIPGYIWVVITLLFLLIVRYSEALYRLDLDIIYGRQFKKLDELITDMRALKTQQ